MNRDEEINVKASQIRLLALDSDGVLTDGGVYIDDDGREFRRFDIKDGLGLRRVMEAGIHVAIISGSNVASVLHRARNLCITEVHLGVDDKLACLIEICERLGLELHEVAYIGDDLPDIPVMERVGLACTPSNGMPLVQAKSDFVTRACGGYGAVREVADKILMDDCCVR